MSSKISVHSSDKNRTFKIEWTVKAQCKGGGGMISDMNLESGNHGMEII